MQYCNVRNVLSVQNIQDCDIASVTLVAYPGGRAGKCYGYNFMIKLSPCDDGILYKILIKFHRFPAKINEFPKIVQKHKVLKHFLDSEGDWNAIS